MVKPIIAEALKRPNYQAKLENADFYGRIRSTESVCEYPDAVIVSGDAVVSKNGRIYEKPRDREDAAGFLRELSGSERQFAPHLL